MKDILLVDLSSVLYPIWHMETTNPDPNATSTKTVARVRALASGQPHVAVCIDSPKSFRKELDPTYKAQRVPNAPLVHQLKLTIETLKADGFPVWGAEGFEADDVIASACLAASGKIDDARVVIASADKDLLQLVGDAIVVKSLKDGSELGGAEVKAKFGVEPKQVQDFLTMVGDTADNIKGMPGVGPKFAAGFLQEFGSLDLLYDAIDKGITPTLTPVQRTKFQEFRKQLPLTRSLIQLRYDVPIAFDEIFKPRAPTNDEPAYFPGGKFAEAEDLAPTEHINTTTGEVTVTPALAEEIRKDVAEMMPDRPITPAVSGGVAGKSDGMAVKVAARQPPPPVFDPIRPAALVPQVVDYERQLEPTSLAEAVQLAKYLFDSRLFSAWGSGSAVLSILLSGRELGMGPMASLRAFDNIQGKPTMKADLIRALVLRSGKAKYLRCSERTATQATFVTHRIGDPEPVSLTYTIQDAQMAGLVKPGSGWTRNPQDMLVARAGAKLSRLVYPDICHGLIGSEEFD